MDVTSPLRLHGNRALDAADPVDPGDLVNLRTLVARLGAALAAVQQPAGTGTGTARPAPFVQAEPATAWTIRHGLRRHPDYVVIDSAGSRIWPNDAYPDLDTLVLTFSVPTSGTAELD